VEYIDAETEVKKENFIYKVKKFRRDTTYKNNYVTFPVQEIVLVCETKNLKTGKTETVEFVAGYGTLCLTKQLRKAKDKISRGMLQVAYNLIMDEIKKIEKGGF